MIGLRRDSRRHTKRGLAGALAPHGPHLVSSLRLVAALIRLRCPSIASPFRNTVNEAGKCCFILGKLQRWTGWLPELSDVIHADRRPRPMKANALPGRLGRHARRHSIATPSAIIRLDLRHRGRMEWTMQAGNVVIVRRVMQD